MAVQRRLDRRPPPADRRDGAISRRPSVTALRSMRRHDQCSDMFDLLAVARRVVVVRGLPQRVDRRGAHVRVARPARPASPEMYESPRLAVHGAPVPGPSARADGVSAPNRRTSAVAANAAASASRSVLRAAIDPSIGCSPSAMAFRATRGRRRHPPYPAALTRINRAGGREIPLVARSPARATRCRRRAREPRPRAAPGGSSRARRG